MVRTEQLTMIGWREWVALPEWGVGAIKAKIDTGARTSALHAFDLESFERSGEEWVRFSIHPWQRSVGDAVLAEAVLIDERQITSSSGTTSLRPVVRARIEFGDRSHEIELTLTRRDEMGFRMLIGRQALRARYAIDPGHSYLTGRPDRSIRRKNRGAQ